jgi:hypothetical protein
MQEGKEEAGTRDAAGSTLVERLILQRSFFNALLPAVSFLFLQFPFVFLQFPLVLLKFPSSCSPSCSFLSRACISPTRNATEP